MAIKTPHQKSQAGLWSQKPISLHKINSFHVVKSTQSFIKCEAHSANSLDFKKQDAKRTRTHFKEKNVKKFSDKRVKQRLEEKNSIWREVKAEERG